MAMHHFYGAGAKSQRGWNPMDAKPVVVIDGRMIGKVGHGIGNYVSDLILGLSEIDRDLPYEPVFLIQSAMKDRDLWRGFRTQIIHAPFLNPSEMVEVPKRLKSLKASLYHSTSFASLPYCPCDHLQTIHDLNHLQFGSFQNVPTIEYCTRLCEKS